MTGVQTCALPICFPVTICRNAYLNDIIDTAEGVILPMLVKYSSPIGSAELTDDVATFFTVGEHKFNEGQSVVIAGVSATFNGTRTITDVSDDHTEFTAAITASDVSFFNVIPSGTATLVGAGNYVGNSRVESAVLATAEGTTTRGTATETVPCTEVVGGKSSEETLGETSSLILGYL